MDDLDRLLTVDCYGEPIDPDINYHIVPQVPFGAADVSGKDLLAAAAALKEFMREKDTELGWQQFHESDPAVYGEDFENG